MYDDREGCMKGNQVQLLQEPIIKISCDYLIATVYLIPPIGDKEYTVEEILRVLSAYGVKQGIKEDVITNIIEDKRYNQEIVIAQGVEKINGRNGYYEFLFNTDPKPRPSIREDGSVDFYNIKCFEPVQKGQAIANYYKASNGAYGWDIKGNMITPKPGKDLPALRGKSFRVNNEGTKYIATQSGKIELIDNQIIAITPILYISGCVDYTVGNLLFDGDIVIQNDVLSGFIVEASGSIFVNGSVESATIIAGKDIVIKHGMQGAERGSVVAGGMVMAKFFEATDIKAGGDISTSAIMNCRVFSDKKVVVVGQFGAIVGGYVSGKEGIVVSKVGNNSEIITHIEVGVTKEDYQLLNDITIKVQRIENEIACLKEILSLIEKKDDKSFVGGEIVESYWQRDKVIDTRSVREGEMAQLNKTYEDKKKEIWKVSNAEIRILSGLHKGAVVHMNARIKEMNTITQDIAICTRGKKIVVYNGSER